jgi:hypothetical protein
MRPVGEVAFGQKIADASASGAYESARAAAAIIGRTDLKMGEQARPVLEAMQAASPNHFRGIRHSVGWDASSFLKPAIPRLPHQDTPASSSLTHPQPPVQTALSRAASCCEPLRHTAAADT